MAYDNVPLLEKNASENEYFDNVEALPLLELLQLPGGALTRIELIHN